MNNIMLDLETMGTAADSAIISIGACKFDIDAGIIDKFYINIDLESCTEAGLTIDANTVMWWMQQSDEARAAFNSGNERLYVALCCFSEWIGADAILWGNGSDFDNAILANAYKASDIILPWKFWNNRCYRTAKGMNKNIKLERSGTHHNALDDAITQAEHLIKIMSSKNAA